MRCRLLFVALAALLATPAVAEPVQVRFASFVGPGHPLNADIITEFIERVNRDSKGTLKIELFPGGTLAKPADVYRNVATGVADMGWSIAGYTPGRFKELAVSELPFEVRDTREGSVALWKLYDQGLVNGFDAVKVISIMTANPSRLHLREADADWKNLTGRKIRAASPLLAAAVSSLGATPLGMPVPQVAESLSKGVIDGALADWFALDSWNIMGSTRTHLDVPFGTPAAYVIMNKATYERLPAAAEKALEKHGGEAFARLWGTRLYRHDMATRKRVADSSQHRIVSLSKEKAAALREQLRPVTGNWLEETPNGDEVLATFREKVKQARQNFSN